jgi:hypothetical protein
VPHKVAGRTASHDNGAHSSVICNCGQPLKQGIAHFRIEIDPLRTSQDYDGDAIFKSSRKHIGVHHWPLRSCKHPILPTGSGKTPF